jgi:hypothetical protein
MELPKHQPVMQFAESVEKILVLSVHGEIGVNMWYDDITYKCQRILGFEIEELLEIKRKLLVLGIDLKDLTTFLDRDKVQLFAEMRLEIKILEQKLQTVRDAVTKA